MQYLADTLSLSTNVAVRRRLRSADTDAAAAVNPAMDV